MSQCLDFFSCPVIVPFHNWSRWTWTFSVGCRKGWVKCDLVLMHLFLQRKKQAMATSLHWTSVQYCIPFPWILCCFLHIVGFPSCLRMEYLIIKKEIYPQLAWRSLGTFGPVVVPLSFLMWKKEPIKFSKMWPWARCSLEVAHIPFVMIKRAEQSLLPHDSQWCRRFSFIWEEMPRLSCCLKFI